LDFTQHDYEEVRTILESAGRLDLFNKFEDKIKPPRRYTKDDGWKHTSMQLYLDNEESISREEIYTTKGFPSNTNRSQTIKRFIGWLERQVGHELSYDKESKAYYKAVDNSHHYDAIYDLIIEHGQMNKASFAVECSKRELNQKRTKVEMQNRGVTIYGNGLMVVEQ
tara:strand:- start:32 stop:532 length:501 start_codon:yes stop_codon:yes gene_type:complete